MQFVRGAGATAVIPDQHEIDAALASILDVFPIRRVRRELRLIHPERNLQIGSINITKTRISLRKLQLPGIENVYVKPASLPLDDEAYSVLLKRHIDQNNFFTVLFSDPTLVYLDGELYKDDSLTD